MYIFFYVIIPKYIKLNNNIIKYKMSTIIINTDEFQILQDDKNATKYIIHFLSYSESLIKSVTRTNIILGSTIIDEYKSLAFKATSVKTLQDFKKELKIANGSNKMPYNTVLKMISHLTKQIEYLITINSKAFLGYDPEKIIVIDGNKFMYLSNDYLLDITSNETLIVTFPFESTMFFSPEVKMIREIPTEIYYKTIYYSLGYLIIDCLLLREHNDEIVEQNEIVVQNEIVEQNEIVVQNEIVEQNEIKGTKLYGFLQRCLKEDPKKRSLIFI